MDILAFSPSLEARWIVQDRDGALLFFADLTMAFGWLKLIWADGGYTGRPVT